jgi:hypothetical protein
MGLTLVRRLEVLYFFHTQAVRLFASSVLLVSYWSISAISCIWFFFSHMMFRNSIEFLQGGYPSRGCLEGSVLLTFDTAELLFCLSSRVCDFTLNSVVQLSRWRVPRPFCSREL